jgi:NAD(P)-dependent dehydrogenase (short-subunit alcohol dehydrogenase family)
MASPRRWRTALVTGGSSGIGLDLADRLLGRGAHVAVFDRLVQSGVRERLAERAAGVGSTFGAWEVDVRDRDGLERAVAEAAAAVGPPELVVNCAGVQISKAFEALSAEEFDHVVGVNLTGSRNVAAAVLPRMQAGGRLALVASMGGLVANYGYAAYSASKFGVVGLAGVLRLEYAPRRIGVSVICPPEVDTPMVMEEHATGDPIGLALKTFAGRLGLEEAGAEILAALDAGTWMIVPGRRARLARHLARLAPGLMNALGDRRVRRAMRAR